MRNNVKEIVKPGKKLRLFYMEGNSNNKLMHILSIIDGDQVVYKFWRRSGNCWIYKIESMYSFELRMKYLAKV